MDISDDYKEVVGLAAKAIDDYTKSKGAGVSSAVEIISGALSDHEDVLNGEFILTTTTQDGERLRKSASDMAAAIMTEISWNTRNSIVISEIVEGHSKFVLEV
jgi:hypothetical protein